MWLIGFYERVMQIFGFYVVALFSVFAFLVGSVYTALFMIVVAELMSNWRPMPKLGPESYNDPTPAGWQTPMRALTLYFVIKDLWALPFMAIFVTVLLGAIFVSLTPLTFGLANFVVAGLIAGWLLTRPLWSPKLKKFVAQQFQGVQKQMAKAMPTVSVDADGINFDTKTRVLGRGSQRSFVIHVSFAEIEEARTMDSNTAQAYWQSMMEYDPSLNDRAGLEMVRYIKGELPRPSIYESLGVATHLLVRAPTLLYLTGGAESGPAAVTAWQAWQAAHAAPSATPA